MNKVWNIDNEKSVKTNIEKFGVVYQISQKFDDEEEESVIILDKESIERIYKFVNSENEWK